MSKIQKALQFVGDHAEFFAGLAVGLAAPVVYAKLRGVELPVKVEASASIDTGNE